MAMTPAEKQRAYRMRKRKEETRKNDALADLYREPFFKFYEDHGEWSTLAIALHFAGYEVPDFPDDRGPEAYSIADHEIDPNDPDDDPFEGKTNSLGRAELMVGSFIDAAITLAGMVNGYKKKELRARLAEIEAADLSDPAVKKAALKDAARLHKMLDQLEREVRWTFPQWKVTG